MQQRTGSAVALGLGVAAGCLIAAAWALAVRNGSADPLAGSFGPDLLAPIGLTAMGVVVLVVAGRQTNVVGWLFLAAGLLVAVRAAADQYTLLGVQASPGLPAVNWMAWTANWELYLVFPGGLLLFALLLFPDGHLPSPRWRLLAWTTPVYNAVFLWSGMVGPRSIPVGTGLRSVSSPIGGRGLPFAPADLLWLVGLLLIAAAGASLVLRYRRSGGEVRHQIKWFAYAVGFTVVALLVGAAFTIGGPANRFNATTWQMNLAIVLGIGFAIPTAFAIAILKYRLYDIDVVISRTLVYGALAALITGVYVAIAVGLGELVGSGGKPNLGLSILATAIVAVGFQPARERLQRMANRLVYGKRATPYEVLSQFSSRVAESYAGEEVLRRMARVLREGTGAEAATVWLKGGGELRPAATDPDALVGYEPRAMLDGVLPELPGATQVVAVRHQEEVLGALSIVKRRGESLTPLEEKLLGDLGHQAGLVLKNVGLTADLQARLEELHLSRQRLVSAQDEERRRLERNLHDGAQQHLVALKVKLGLAEMLLSRDVEKARATLTQLKADTDEALETLRDLARGIYPPLLADKGLAAALDSQARKATVPVSVDAEGVGRYSQEVEATAYFCCLEALQNVQKYAGAAQVRVRLRDLGRELRFTVEDDGCGFDPATARRGAGLTNMEDRLDSLGGSVELRSIPGHGTTLSGVLPVPSSGRGVVSVSMPAFTAP